MSGKSKGRQPKKATMTIKERRAAKRAKSEDTGAAIRKRKSGFSGE